MIFAGFLLSIIGSAILGSIYNWLISLMIILVYLFMAAVTYITSKFLQNRYLRQAHFTLAIFLRAENNRYYLTNNIELRPGYLAKWVEVNIHDPTKGKIIDSIRDRYQSLREPKKSIMKKQSDEEDEANKSYHERNSHAGLIDSKRVPQFDTDPIAREERI